MSTVHNLKVGQTSYEIYDTNCIHQLSDEQMGEVLDEGKYDGTTIKEGELFLSKDGVISKYSKEPAIGVSFAKQSDESHFREEQNGPFNIIRGGNFLLATQNSNYYWNGVLYSANDGVNWTPVSAFSNKDCDGFYHNGKFYVYCRTDGKMYQSTDPSQGFTEITDPGYRQSGYYTKYCVVADDTFITSGSSGYTYCVKNGTPAKVSASMGNCYQAAYFKGEYYLACSSDGVYKISTLGSAPTKILDSSCGTIAANDDIVLCINENGMCYSTDGSNWTYVDYSKFPDIEYSVMYFEPCLITVGSTIVCLESQIHAYTTDGENWTNISLDNKLPQMYNYTEYSCKNNGTVFMTWNDYNTGMFPQYTITAKPTAYSVGKAEVRTDATQPSFFYSFYGYTYTSEGFFCMDGSKYNISTDGGKTFSRYDYPEASTYVYHIANYNDACYALLKGKLYKINVDGTTTLINGSTGLADNYRYLWYVGGKFYAGSDGFQSVLMECDTATGTFTTSTLTPGKPNEIIEADNGDIVAFTYDGTYINGTKIDDAYVGGYYCVAQKQGMVVRINKNVPGLQYSTDNCKTWTTCLTAKIANDVSHSRIFCAKGWFIWLLAGQWYKSNDGITWNIIRAADSNVNMGDSSSGIYAYQINDSRIQIHEPQSKTNRWQKIDVEKVTGSVHTLNKIVAIKEYAAGNNITIDENNVISSTVSQPSYDASTETAIF